MPIKTARHCVGRTARFSFFFFPSHFYTSDIDSTGRTWWPCDMYIPKYRRNLIDDRWILPCKRHSPMMATTSSLPCIDCPSVFAVRGYSTGYTTKLWSLFDSSPIMMTYYWTQQEWPSPWRQYLAHTHVCQSTAAKCRQAYISFPAPPKNYKDIPKHIFFPRNQANKKSNKKR